MASPIERRFAECETEVNSKVVIQTNDRIVAEVNQLSIAETQFGNFLRRPDVHSVEKNGNDIGT